MKNMEKTYQQLLLENAEFRKRLTAYEEAASTVETDSIEGNEAQVIHTDELFEAPLWVEKMKERRANKSSKRGRFQARIQDKYLRAIFDSAPAGISVATDPSCRVIRHNPAAARFLRLELWESPSFLSPDKPKFKMLYQGKEMLTEEMPLKRAVWKGEGARGLEIEFVWEDGVRKFAVYNSNPLFSDEGEIIGAIATFEDITARRQAEHALQDERKFLNAVIENTEAHLVYLDPDFNFIWVNSAYAKACRRPAEDFIGRNHFEFYPHEENEAIFRKARDTGKPIRFEAKPFVFPDQPGRGVTYWDWTLTPVKNSSGKVTGLVFSLADVTERKLNEEALRETRDYLENLISYANAPIIVWDPGFRIIRFNYAFERLTGNSVDDVLGKSLEILFPDDRKEESMSIIRRTASGEYWEAVEIPILQKSGDIRTVLWNSANIHDVSGKIVATIAQGQDITERKVAEEALRRSQQREELLSTVASRLLTSEDPRDIIDQLCQKTMEYLGCDVFFNYLADDERSRLHFNTCAGIPGEEAERIEWLDYGEAVCGCTALEGRRIVAEKIPETLDPRTDLVRSYEVKAYACHPLKAGDRVIGTISFGTRSRETFTEEELTVMKTVADHISIAISSLLTNRRLRESESRYRALSERLREVDLRHSEDRFYKAFYSNPLPMSINRIEEGKLLQVNSAWLIATGYAQEEVIGKTTVELDLWVDHGFYREKMLEFHEKGRLSNAEIDFRTQRGETRYSLVSAEIIILNDEQCMLASIVDITEHKLMEKEIARLDRLNLVGEMAASIGHEIRNPMTTIRGFLQMLSTKEGCQPYREYYDLMIEELDRANSIITEYLSMARDKAVDLKPGYLNSIIKTLYPMIQADASYTDKQVKLELDSPPRLLIDEKEIRQLIMNLARNGLEAMPPGGVLTIRTRAENGEAVLEVEDQGEGIPLEVLDRLGTPFQTTKENGTGLGLAVSYSIVHRHSARIEVKTGREGTTFSVRFKAKQ